MPRPKPPAVLPADGSFPGFLTWRELCNAYVSIRERRKDGGPWVNPAKNSFYQEDAFKKLQKQNRLIMIMPPGHIKTTLFAIEYPTWKIMSDPDRLTRILVVQKNADEAKKLIQEVETRLSEDEHYEWLAEQLEARGEKPILNPLKQWFTDNPFRGSQRGRDDSTKWGASGFTTLGKRGGEKDLTMQALGVGSQIQGIRSDLIILDDIQDPQATPKDSEDKLDWFRKVIMGRVTDKQQVVVLANFFNPDDFAHKLITAYPDEFQVVQYPALSRAGLGGKMTALCPEFWSIDSLKKKRKEVGEEVWHYTWMQETTSYDAQCFKREVLEASRDESFKIGDKPYAATDVFIGVDPAAAATGHCAMVAWGLNRNTKQRFLIDVFNKTGMRHWDNVVRSDRRVRHDVRPKDRHPGVEQHPGLPGEQPALPQADHQYRSEARHLSDRYRHRGQSPSQQLRHHHHRASLRQRFGLSALRRNLRGQGEGR